MRFEDKYPGAPIDHDTPDHRYRSGVIGTCFMCGQRTAWVDICFEAHLCSEECDRAALEDMCRRTKLQDAEDRYRPSF